MIKLIQAAIAPILWGTTYIVTTELLPDYGPLTVALFRALPIGIVLMLVYGKLPEKIWWWRSFVLGGLNIGIFFALLFVATYRLPGGVAATIGAIQPLLVILLAWFLFKQRPLPLVLAASALGIIGVGMLVLGPTAQLDLIGIIAALAGALSMAAGVALTKYWGRPVSLIVFTGWQLTAGGIILMPFAFIFEYQMMQAPTLTNLVGFGWLALLNTGLGYALWFRGIEQLQVWQVSFLGLLSPIVAIFAGYLILNQTLSNIQIIGIVLTFTSILVAQKIANRRRSMMKLPYIATEAN